MLSSQALTRAREFVDAHGRPLEQVRLRQVLGEVSPEDVAQALLPYQVDGGFGRALEPDCRAPQPSTLATLTALDVLRTHDVPGDHPLVAQACAWLVREVRDDHEGRAVWRFIPPEAQSSPHAPWWDQASPGQLEETFDGFVANPGTALTAHLWRHEAASPGSVPSDLLERLGEQARAVVAQGVAPDEVNAHDALAHLAGEPAVPAPLRREVTAYLQAVLPGRVMRAPDDFADYGIHPLWVAPTPSHPLAATLSQAVAAALDHTVVTQERDGSWAPFWSWESVDPDAWALAEQEWRGSLVVRNIAALQDHGRIQSG